MTWDEFKALVDKTLAEQGKDGSEEIWYIDLSYPEPRRLEIHVSRELGLAVSQ